MSLIELVAAFLGFVNVWLTIRENVWCWPVGILNVAMYVKVFWDAKLYSDMGLQVVYIVLQFWGWYHWLYGGRDKPQPPVTLLGKRRFAGWISAAALGSMTLGAVMHLRTDAALPYVDATATVVSLAAQYLMTRKYLECWFLWIFVDVISVGMYAFKQLWPTTALYALFLAMAAGGYFVWRRSWKKEESLRAA
ncbi:MAG: Nicotinamide riboside transporter PnuC [bacterium ADurb.Bin374]|nr:MAG: Nicotinamide riboside transporter PnuC [bacterium ADurb.Bin374]